MIYLIAHTTRKGRIEFVGRVYVNRDNAQQKLNEYTSGADGNRCRASDFSLREFNTVAEAVASVAEAVALKNREQQR